MVEEKEIDYLRAILERLDDRPGGEQRRHDELIKKLESIEHLLMDLRDAR